jgi:hypothetical protein
VTHLDHDLLSTYLNDHLGGSTTGQELAGRLLEQNRDTLYEPFLQRVSEEIKEDRQTLLEIMGRLGVSESKVKVAGGWAAEKISRLKANDRIRGYSPLSRLLELEGLSTGVQGKLSLWQVLGACADAEPALDKTELARLEQRARSQLQGLEEHRIQAGREALAGEAAPAT